MKKIYFLLLICFFVSGYSQESPTQAEVDNMMKKAQSIIDKNTDKDDDQYLTGFEDVDEEELLLKLPPKKTALLLAISKKALSKAELTAYITKLKIQLLQKSDAGKVKSANAAINTIGNQPDKLHIEAISTWYNGLQQEAAILLLEAAQKNPDDAILLNNLAAFLNMGGTPQIAIPILKNLLLSYPNNAMVLNNLGQSYANLGEADTALYYIGRCLKIAPMHASANHTAGVIEATKGNSTKAETHLTNAVKASPNPQSIAALKQLKPEKPISNFLKPRFKMPGDFNPLKYEFPKQIENLSETKIVQKMHEEFWNYLNELIMQYSALMEQEGENGEKILKQKIAAAQKNAFSSEASSFGIIRPFTATANIAIVHLIPDLAGQQIDVDRNKQIKEKEIAELKEKHKIDIESLNEEYQIQYDKLPYCGEGRCGGEELQKAFCKKKTDVTNSRLKELAALRRDIQTKLRMAALNKFELMGYWGYLAGANEAFAKQGYYSAIHEYLKDVQKAAVTQDLGYVCDMLPDVNAPEKIVKEEAVKSFCPYNITVGFVVGKIKLDCDKFSITGGEGIRFKYEKEFLSGSSSLSMGVGLGFDAGIGTSVSAGVSIEATEAIYIGFDKDNNITDAGLEVTARASIESISKGETLKVTERVELKGGYKMGVNSGLTFTGNAFKMLK